MGVSLVVTVGAAACGGGYETHNKNTTALAAIVRDSAAKSGDRCSAAKELGKRKARQAVPALNSVLAAYGVAVAKNFDLPQWKLASCVVAALGQMGDPSAVTPILKAWDVADTTDAEGTRFNDFFPSKARDALATIGPPAVPRLIAILNTWTPRLASDVTGNTQPSDEYSNAITVLGRIGDRRAEPALVAALKARWSGEDAGKALALMYRDNVKHLLPLLRSQDTVDIAYGLVGLGVPGTEPALRDALLRFGGENLAREYLNCGNATLEAAAKDWAYANGYTVTELPTLGGSEQAWGSLK